MTTRSVTKFRVLLTTLFIGVLLFAVPVVVQADERITSFDVDIQINEDSSITVTEEIAYDFGSSSRHGIFRDIPVAYETDTGDRSISLDVDSVTRDTSAEPFTTSSQGDDKRIKIGDPDKTISGEHAYTITYDVRKALNYFEEYDELYWNITGHGWDVPISQASADIRLPESVKPGNMQASCYAGSQGSQESCDDLRVASSTVTAQTSQLSTGEGLTVAVGFPKGLVTQPTIKEKLYWWLSDNWIVLLPGVVFFVMFYLWRRFGRDPELRSITAHYEPPEDMLPTLVGALVNESVDNHDITAGIIYLAQQGFLTLKRKEETKLMFFDSVDYELTLEKSPEDAPSDMLQDILGMLFGISASAGDVVTVSELKGDTSVAKKIKALKKDIYKEMVNRNLFVSNPRKRIGWAWGAGILLLWGLGIMAGVFNNLWFFASGAASAVIIVGFGYLMPRKTKQGTRTKEHLLGFQQFLQMTQQERLEFHNAPERTPEEFMEYLPYAVALEAEDNWAEQFSDIYIETPDWYAGDVSGRVAATSFANDLTDATGGIAEGVSSAASGGSGSTGGGSAGGGMGGGGGGSW